MWYNSSSKGPSECSFLPINLYRVFQFKLHFPMGQDIYYRRDAIMRQFYYPAKEHTDLLPKGIIDQSISFSSKNIP